MGLKLTVPREILYAATTGDAEESFDAFVAEFSPKYEKAVQCLAKDRERLLSFFRFPAEHWKHLRTTNPIESAFATVRLDQTEGPNVPNVAPFATQSVMLLPPQITCLEERRERRNSSRWVSEVLHFEVLPSSPHFLHQAQEALLLAEVRQEWIES